MYNLAQLNVARMKFPIEDSRFRDFVEALDPVNASGEASPGFVWRLQTDEGDATGIRMFDDDKLLVNLTVWESLEQLRDFVRSERHLAIMRRRSEWFDASDQATLVLWWVPAGYIPTPAEAEEKLLQLRRHGATPEAFDFRTPYPPPA